MQKEKQELLENKVVQRFFQGGFPMDFSMDKPSLADEWICQLRAGKVRFLLQEDEYELSASKEQNCFFIVHDDCMFRMLDGSPDMELQVFSIGHGFLSVIYPFLGSEANSRLFSKPLITSEGFSIDLVRMLILACRELQMVLDSHYRQQRDKLLLHLLIHIYLLFDGGIMGIETQHTGQPFFIVNRFYELFNAADAYKHRDAKYYADRLNISPRYFFEICKKETGRTPKQLIDDAISSKIRHAILTTDCSLQQLSIAFNFPDQTTFAQYFKRNVGMSPSAFKRKYR